MPVSIDEFQEISTEIAELGEDEIHLRTVINRQYYYIFHNFRETNDEHDESHFTYDGYGNDHAEVSDFLERLGFNDLADDFDDIRNKRNKADYEIDESLGEFEYQMFLADVEDFEEDASAESFLPEESN